MYCILHIALECSMQFMLISFSWLKIKFQFHRTPYRTQHMNLFSFRITLQPNIVMYYYMHELHDIEYACAVAPPTHKHILVVALPPPHC